MNLRVSVKYLYRQPTGILEYRLDALRFMRMFIHLRVLNMTASRSKATQEPQERGIFRACISTMDNGSHVPCLHQCAPHEDTSNSELVHDLFAYDFDPDSSEQYRLATRVTIFCPKFASSGRHREFPLITQGLLCPLSWTRLGVGSRRWKSREATN